MRALLRPMGCGPVRYPCTPVRVSAHPRGQYAVWSMGQSLRPHAELSQVSNLGAAAAVVAGSVQGDEHDVLPCGGPAPPRVRPARRLERVFDE